MMSRTFMRGALLTLAAMLLGPLSVQAREAIPSDGFPVQMVVTVEARHGGAVPVITREDVTVYQGRDRVPVTDWFPLQGDKSRLELFVLLDDASRTSLGSQLDDLRQFIISQPPATAVGVGYMQNGTVAVVQNFTTNHLQAAMSVRLPLGTVGAFASPYLSLLDLIKRWPIVPPLREPLMNRWPDIPVCHEVLMITDGIDRFGGTGPVDPYVDEAIEQAQTAGVIVYTIYASGVGRAGRSFWSVNWGQNYLSRIAEETGGEAYFLGYSTPLSFGPYLDEVSQHLNHQYLLTFLAKPGKKAGLQRVKVRTEVPNAELAAADRVYVPAE
jgi:hypothetical protein